MLHLTGFDHMEEEERLEIEAHQRQIMEGVGIVR
jgi:probable rRNA maturation factor